MNKKMNVAELAAPKRYLVETDTDENGDEFIVLVDVTGQEDPVYMVGLESPWLGLPLERIKEYAHQGTYDPHRASLLSQISEVEAKA